MGGTADNSSLGHIKAQHGNLQIRQREYVYACEQRFFHRFLNFIIFQQILTIEKELKHLKRCFFEHGFFLHIF